VRRGLRLAGSSPVASVADGSHAQQRPVRVCLEVAPVPIGLPADIVLVLDRAQLVHEERAAEADRTERALREH